MNPARAGWKPTPEVWTFWHHPTVANFGPIAHCSLLIGHWTLNGDWWQLGRYGFVSVLRQLPSIWRSSIDFIQQRIGLETAQPRKVRSKMSNEQCPMCNVQCAMCRVLSDQRCTGGRLEEVSKCPNSSRGINPALLFGARFLSSTEGNCFSRWAVPQQGRN